MIWAPGTDLHSISVYSNASILLGGLLCFVDLIVVKTLGSDVILGMDWLCEHQALIDCAQRSVSILHPSRVQILCMPHLGNAHRFHRDAYPISEIAKVPIVCVFLDVFPDKLPGMPPDHVKVSLAECLKYPPLPTLSKTLRGRFSRGRRVFYLLRRWAVGVYLSDARSSVCDLCLPSAIVSTLFGLIVSSSFVV